VRQRDCEVFEIAKHHVRAENWGWNSFGKPGCEANGNPDLEYEVEDAHVLAMLRRRECKQGGVGKTTIAYHLAWMYADLGMNMVAVDLDPQANLTTAFLSDDRMTQLWPEGNHPATVYGSVQPLIRRRMPRLPLPLVSAL